MFKKNLTSILSTFNKVKIELEEFISSNIVATEAAAIKISMMEEKNGERFKETKQAQASLAKVKELIGE
jgi:hypothetical protein